MTEIFYLTRHLRTNRSYGGPMAHVDPESARSLLEGVIAAFSVLGGGVAYLSGYYANQALAQDQSPEHLSRSSLLSSWRGVDGSSCQNTAWRVRREPATLIALSEVLGGDLVDRALGANRG